MFYKEVLHILSLAKLSLSHDLEAVLSEREKIQMYIMNRYINIRETNKHTLRQTECKKLIAKNDEICYY